VVLRHRECAISVDTLTVFTGPVYHLLRLIF
jgi:hypothetical protein